MKDKIDLKQMSASASARELELELKLDNLFYKDCSFGQK